MWVTGGQSEHCRWSTVHCTPKREIQSCCLIKHHKSWPITRLFCLNMWNRKHSAHGTSTALWKSFGTLDVIFALHIRGFKTLEALHFVHLEHFCVDPENWGFPFLETSNHNWFGKPEILKLSKKSFIVFFRQTKVNCDSPPTLRNLLDDFLWNWHTDAKKLQIFYILIFIAFYSPLLLILNSQNVIFIFSL